MMNQRIDEMAVKEVLRQQVVQGVPLASLDPRGYEALRGRIREEMRQIVREAEDSCMDARQQERFRELEDDLVLLERWADKPARSVPLGAVFAGTAVMPGGELRLLRPEDSVRELVGGDEGLSLGRYLRGIVTGDWRGAVAEHRALELGDSTLGGYLVPSPLASKVIDLARNRAVCIAAGALTVPLETKDIAFAKVESDPVAYWRDEHAPIQESDITFSRVRLDAQTLAAMVRCSIELFEDAANLDQIVTTALAQALALELDRACLFGQGASSEPLGLYETSDVNRISMGENGGPLQGYYPFVQAIGRILEANGPGPEALAVIMAPREYTAMQSWIDANGNPLQPPEAYQSIRRKLISSQILTDLEYGTAENASCIFVGDFSQLWIGMRTDLRLEVSREAGDAFSKMQVLIRAYLRADVLAVRPAWFSIVDGIVPAAE